MLQHQIIQQASIAAVSLSDTMQGLAGKVHTIAAA
jgi:hypothetical protein